MDIDARQASVAAGFLLHCVWMGVSIPRAKDIDGTFAEHHGEPWQSIFVAGGDGAMVEQGDGCSQTELRPSSCIGPHRRISTPGPLVLAVCARGGLDRLALHR